MRVAKWPYNAFQENIKKAHALAIAQQFLNEFLKKGPERFIQSYVDEAMTITSEVLGFDIMELIRNAVEGPVKKAMEAEIVKRIPKEIPRLDEEATRRAAAKFQKLAEPIISVMTLEGQTLLEQAVVLGVTAYETYISDTVMATLRLNPTMSDKFTRELQERLDWEKIKKHGKDLRETIVALVLEEHNAFDLGKVKNLFRKLAGIENVFGNDETEKLVRRFIEHRHTIVHRAGKVDRKFQEATGSRQARGTTVELTTTYVAEGLDTLSGFAGSAQSQLEAQAAGMAEIEPPD